MPQMAPLMWLSLFAFFLFNFLLFFISTYFLLPPSKINQPLLLIMPPHKNWKW
uniref:ATP synthase F0 subunit 8 n=1 Tax=Stereomastis sculpta TaxID=1522709 RepID=A0A3S6I6R1_9EUCA|nr:ATP synthase F0 subunit 8 [Stereomastis sculpta]